MSEQEALKVPVATRVFPCLCGSARTVKCAMTRRSSPDGSKPSKSYSVAPSFAASSLAGCCGATEFQPESSQLPNPMVRDIGSPRLSGRYPLRPACGRPG